MKTIDELSQNEKAIYAVLSTGNANYLNLCVPILAIIKQAPEKERASLLRYVCENFEQIESDKQISPDCIIINDNEKEKLSKLYRKLSDEMLISLVSKNLKEDVFYSELWNIVINPFFNTSNAQAFVMFNMLMDNQIPYYYSEDGTKMADEKFKQLSKKLFNEIAKARFILSREFDQRTQRASIIIEILNKLEKEEQIVLMAHIFGLFDSKNDKAMRALQAAVRR